MRRLLLALALLAGCASEPERHVCMKFSSLTIHCYCPGGTRLSDACAIGTCCPPGECCRLPDPAKDY